MSVGIVLEPALNEALRARTVVRVMVSAPEGFGRTHQLRALEKNKADMPLVVVECAKGRVATSLLRALLPTSSTHDELLWELLVQAPQLSFLEPERKQLAAELLASLFSIKRPEFRTSGLDGEARREGAFLELARWVGEKAQAKGLVLAFDDVHRCDDDGLALIELLSQQEASAPLALIVSFDDDASRFTPSFRARREGWKSDSRWQRVRLEQPSREEVIARLEGFGCSEQTADALCAHAKGNPGLVAGLWCYWQEQPELPVSELPSTFEALRVANVKLLGEEVTRAMQTLAVLGAVAPLEVLHDIDPELPTRLRRAVDAGLVVIERQGSLEVYRFTDTRLVADLASAVSSPQALGVLVTAGAWAAQALERITPNSFAEAANVIVPLARAALDASATSVWLEAWAFVAPGKAEAVARLEAALSGASGVRRLVLMRRLAELKLFLGRPEEALASLATVTRAVPTSSLQAHQRPSSRALEILAAQPLGTLDRWDTISVDEAHLAIEILKGECLSHLLKREETEEVFRGLENKLGKVKSAASTHLWLRWARAWSWFLCEILGRADEAVKACAMVRQKVSSTALLADEEALGFVRAQEIASVSVGDFTRAKQLADELITLAERGGRLRDVCLAWNARAILHFGQGELVAARRAFEKAIEMARTTAWTRREAISSHNLALVLAELFELDAAAKTEALYSKLSMLIGNHAARAEAPMVFANIELSRGDLTAAEASLSAARKVSEASGWSMMVAATRALTGRLRLLRYLSAGDGLELTRAKNDFLAALEVLEEHSTAWTEELDPGEVYALYAATLKLSGQAGPARDLLERASARMPKENTVSHHQLAVARAYLAGESLEPTLAWFQERSFVRRVSLWRLLQN